MPSRCFPRGPSLILRITRDPCAAWKKALQVREALSVETRLLRADGAFRWHQIRAEPITDDAGHIIKWMGTSTNVHSFKEGEELSAFLLEMSTDFARIDNPHELVSTAMLRLRQRLGAAQVTLAEFDDAHGQVVMLRQDRSDSPNLQVVNLPVGPFESITVEARKGLVTVLDDVPTDEPIANFFSRWYGHAACGRRRVGTPAAGWTSRCFIECRGGNAAPLEWA